MKVFLTVLLSLFLAAVAAAAETEATNLRSADPCGRLVEWQSEIVSPELWDGQAEHSYSPAQLLVLAAKENQFNLVSELVILQLSQRLISGPSEIGWNQDFEYRLLEAMNYGSLQTDRLRWYGFAAQCVGMTYQFSLERSRGLTFPEAFRKYTAGQEQWTRFKRIYAAYAQVMNQLLGTNFLLGSYSEGYFSDFLVTADNQETYFWAVQHFLDYWGSPLADPLLFQKEGLPSIVDYNRLNFCE